MSEVLLCVARGTVTTRVTGLIVSGRLEPRRANQDERSSGWPRGRVEDRGVGGHRWILALAVGERPVASQPTASTLR
jgi:hypothetical protein